MKNRTLNQLLCDKMTAEQETYRSWLLNQPPEEILNHTFEYIARQEILIAMGELLLPELQAAALLTSPAPLADIYKDFCNVDAGLTDIIWDCVRDRAERLLEEQKKHDTDK